MILRWRLLAAWISESVLGRATCAEKGGAQRLTLKANVHHTLVLLHGKMAMTMILPDGLGLVWQVPPAGSGESSILSLVYLRGGHRGRLKGEAGSGTVPSVRQQWE